MNFNELGTVLGKRCGKRGNEHKNLMVPDADDKFEELGYAVYCFPCGHLVADTEDGLDDMGGWAESRDRDIIYDAADGGDSLTLLDMWPDNIYIFETEDYAKEAIGCMVESSDNEWTSEDFGIYIVYSVVRKVSALAIGR